MKEALRLLLRATISVYKSDRFSFTYEAKYDDSAAAADGMFGISDASGSTFLININEYGESKESDRASFKNDLETAFKSMDENFKFTKYEDTKIDGVDAVVADYTLMGINVHSVCVFADDALYNITLTAADMQSTFAKDMLKTIDSFTLN